MSTRTFEYKDDKSSKFWEVTLKDSTVTVRYGKTGTNGQTQEKLFADPASAAKHVEKLIAEKTGKGYIERGSVQSGSTATVVDSAKAGEQITRGSMRTKGEKATKPKPSKPKKPLQDPEATPETLLSLLDKDDASNRLLAKHPKASPELLEKLSHSSDLATRKAVCLNPNASRDVLIRLAPQFPGDFFLNPVFDWLLLEDPDLLFKLGKGVLKNLLKRPDCPMSFIHWAVKHGDEQEQLALTMNPSTPKEVIETLSQRKGTVGDAAKGRSSTSSADQAVPQQELDATYLAEVKKALGEVKPDEVSSAWKRDMITVAQMPWLSLECRLLLDDIHLSLVVLGAMKGREQELASHSNPEVRAWLARFVEEDTALLESLALDSNVKVRAAVAVNPNCTDAVYLRLLSDKQPGVRAAAAHSSKITPKQAAALAADPSPAVREAAIAAWCVPVESLQTLAQERSVAIRKPALARLDVVSKSAANPATAPDELDKIAASAKAETKRLLAANPSTPVMWLERFAMEGSGALDKALMENPRLPAALADMVCRRLAETLGPLQRIDFLERVRTPRSIRELIGEKSWLSRWPKCEDWLKAASEYLLAPWTGHGDEALLEIPRGLESAYAGSMLRSARLLGLAHPRTPPELLIKRSNSVDWVERLAIARNTSLPPNLVAKFQKDTHRLVAAQALVTEKSKTAIKERQEEVLTQPMSSVDWDAIIEEIKKEMTRKGVRTWDWYKTPWWPHLPVNERMGLVDDYRRRLNGKTHVDLLFAAAPFGPERLSTHSWNLIQEWLLDFNETPLNILENRFATQENLAAQRNWLARVRAYDDPNLPEKLRQAALGLKLEFGKIVGKWAQLASHLENHSDIPEDAAAYITELRNTKWVAPFDPKWSSDSKADVRKRALKYPDVPIETIEQLKKDKNKEVRLLAEAVYIGSMPALPASDRGLMVQEVLKKVLSQSSDFKEELSALVKCPSEILDALSKEKDVWDFGGALAYNPNTPEDVLLKLGLKHRKVKDDVWLGPGAFEQLTSSVCNNPSVTFKVFHGLARAKSATVRMVVADEAKTPQECLIILMADPDPKVRAAIARRKDLTLEMQHSLVSDPDPIVRVALAESSYVPMEVRLLLARDQNPQVRYAALEQRGMPQSIYVELVRAGERVFPPECVANIHDEETLKVLAKEGGVYSVGSPGTYGYRSNPVQESILDRHRALPAAVLTILANRAEYRRKIAQRSDLPVGLLEALANDSDELVVLEALSNPLMPNGRLREAVLSKQDSKYWEAVVNNPLCQPNLVEEVVEKIEISKWRARSWYAGKLAGESRRSQNQSFLTAALDVAGNSKAPLEKLRFLLDSGVWLIRWMISNNPALPESERKDIQAALWAEIEDALWGPVHPLPKFDVLHEDGIRSALDKLDLMPPQEDKRAIAAAAKSTEVLQRVAAVLSPGVQPSILKMLLEDSVENVRSLAAEKLRAMELKT